MQGFIASVVFKSPPTVTLTNTGSYTIATKGDGTWASLVLTPTASKTVTMIFNYDGINMNVYVSEIIMGYLEKKVTSDNNKYLEIKINTEH